MRNRLTDLGARLILATRIVDRMYRAFDRMRSEAVLALASEATLDRFNDLAYGTARDYLPDSEGFRARLFPWEEQVIGSHFPPPPARVLVGGAGGGREAFALAARGFEVVAFEPSPHLAAAMAARAQGTAVRAYRAGYEDLPALRPAAPGLAGVDLDALAPFDASVVGWGSFSHLRTHARRVRTLRAFARATRGPVVVSFLRFRADAADRRLRRRFRRLFPGRFNRDPGNAFSMMIGFYHEMDDATIAALAREAGLRIVRLSTDSRDTNWPHAVMLPAGLPASQAERPAGI